MAIPKEKNNLPAKRFEILSKETHVGSYCFGNDAGSEVLNVVHNQNKVAESDGKELLNCQGSCQPEQITDQLKPAIDFVQDVARETKSQLTNVVDFAKSAPNKLNDWISGVTGNSPAVSKGISNLLTKCVKRGGGIGLGGKPFDFSVNCNGNKLSLGKGGGGSGDCNTSSINDVLNKITGGGYNGMAKSIQSALNALMSLTNMGFSAGLCGVFNALKGSDAFSSLGNLELSKAAGGIMSAVSAAKNTSAWIDMAASSAGLLVKQVYPAVVSDFFGSFTKPANVPEMGLASLAEMSTDAAAAVDGNWYGGESGGFMTIGGMGKPTDDLKTAFSCKVSDKAYTGAQLDTIPSNDMDFVMAAGIAV